MVKNLFILKNKINVLLTSLSLLSFFGCRTANDDLVKGGMGAVKVNIAGLEFSDGEKNAKAMVSSVSGRLVPSDIDEEAQIIRIPLKGDHVMVATLTRVNSSMDNLETSASVGTLAKLQKKIPNGIKYRLVVFDSNGKYVNQKVYTTGSNNPDDGMDLQLEGRKSYKFVIYSYNNRETPPVMDPEHPELYSISGNKDFMYFNTEKVISGETTNYLDVVMKHKYTKVNIKLTAEDNITKFKGSVGPHHIENKVNLLNGELTYDKDSTNLPLVVTAGLNTKQIESSPLFSSKESKSGLIMINSMKVGSNEYTNRSFKFEFKPGTLYNLNLSLDSSLENGNIKILTYNTYLLPNTVVVAESQWAQEERAEKLGEADFIKNYDVLLLQECFDVRACNNLRQKISSTYPYLTQVLGQTQRDWNSTLGEWRSSAPINGGVMVASKHPIEERIQYIFPSGCSTDRYAMKGFVYVRILKNGKRVHFISTHLQSTQSACGGEEVKIREDQLKMIKSFVDSRKIPKNEMLIYGGDFNIIKDTPEYRKIFDLLNVSVPHYAGLPSTWDTKTNTIAGYHYPFPKNKQEYLDYILVSKDHLLPRAWQNITFDPVSSHPFRFAKYYWVDYSDHYPVEGNIYSDNMTPKSSLKYRKYDKVSLKSVKTGKYISSNLSNINEKLEVSGATSNENTWFNLVNIDGNNYFDLRAGKVRVESTERINNFWDMSRGYCTPWFGTSAHIELVLVKKKNGNISTSIEDGDIVAFRVDRGYLRVYNENGRDVLQQNNISDGASEQFEIKINNTSAITW
ncbi:sphingomyelin phosphodiesterase [Elizabethkingia anophelis]|uniref:sphingomyelin phosphodiesterase n=1 Tax=Elizabethkingia anophelis TaxID=1117645 RepID=UPI0020B356AB|nr:sphingomyelin phosphodiesterase [Elizabethkingia anophelis]UTF92216.1 sphingomyelin phosphodiesterase [Elizabethkingia anophelis]